MFVLPRARQVVHRQLRNGGQLSMPKCFEMEATMAREFMRQNGACWRCLRQTNSVHVRLFACARATRTIQLAFASSLADFFEGVRALLVDRDNKPAWNPASLAQVKSDAVDRYFKDS